MVYTMFKNTTTAVIANIKLIAHTDPAPDPNKDSVSIIKALVEDAKNIIKNK